VACVVSRCRDRVWPFDHRETRVSRSSRSSIGSLGKITNTVWGFVVWLRLFSSSALSSGLGGEGCFFHAADILGE
jgi:hypothetical protein